MAKNEKIELMRKKSKDSCFNNKELQYHIIDRVIDTFNLNDLPTILNEDEFFTLSEKKESYDFIYVFELLDIHKVDEKIIELNIKSFQERFNYFIKCSKKISMYDKIDINIEKISNLYSITIWVSVLL